MADAVTLYRMIYLRDGRLRGFAFTAQDAAQASERAKRWAGQLGVTLLTVKTLRTVAEQFELAA